MLAEVWAILSNLKFGKKFNTCQLVWYLFFQYLAPRIMKKFEKGDKAGYYKFESPYDLDPEPIEGIVEDVSEDGIVKFQNGHKEYIDLCLKIRTSDFEKEVTHIRMAVLEDFKNRKK